MFTPCSYKHDRIKHTKMDFTLTVRLNNGVEMPRLGYGVFRMKEGGQVEKAVKQALKVGYRSIDTAYMYHNEEGVAKGIKASGVPRDEIFITTKLGNEQQGYASAKQAIYESLKLLNTDYLDLYLIHWPLGKVSLEAWKAMEELYEEGLIRAIGVSNFNIHHLDYLLLNSRITPAVNQVELHPYNAQPELAGYCHDKNIQLVSWSPLMVGKVTKIPEIIELAKKYKKSPAQITLRWNLQKGYIPIPKTENPERMKSNFDIFDFDMSEQDVKIIDGLNKDQPIVNRRDRIIHLLQMLQSMKFNGRLIRLLQKAVQDRFSSIV